MKVFSSSYDTPSERYHAEGIQAIMIRQARRYHAEGIQAISRWLSKATPPGRGVTMPKAFKLLAGGRAKRHHRVAAGTPLGCTHVWPIDPEVALRLPPANG